MDDFPNLAASFPALNLPVQTFRGITFQNLLEIQKEITAKIHAGDTGSIVMAELQPVITLGRKQEIHVEKGALNSDTFQDQEKIPVVFGDRGGNETYHGPGQWVVFVICKLESFTGQTMGIRKAIARYLNAACEVSNSYFKQTNDLRRAEVVLEGDKIGLWTSRGKLASVGIRVRDGILQSGMALNVFPTQTSFHGINPCGIQGAGPDFLWTKTQNDEDCETKRQDLFLVIHKELIESLRGSLVNSEIC